MSYGTSRFTSRIGGVVPAAIGRTWMVNNSAVSSPVSGWDSALSAVQAAVDQADEGDLILIAPGEYDEDVVVATPRLQLAGVGPRHSVRITGVAAGTSTPMTITGVSEVGLYNLNLEARSGGDGLLMQGQLRRCEIATCKIHGGTNAIRIAVAGGGQPVDLRFEENVLGNATNGFSVDYAGGDPGHQLKLLGNTFERIVTDCILEDGATHDWLIAHNIFTANDGTEPTRFLDIDAVGSTGFVTKNVFHTTVFSTAKFAIASGVLFAGNESQAENPSAAVGGTFGRPD